MHFLINLIFFFPISRRFGTYTETELWNTLSEQAWNDKTLDEKIQVWDIAQAWITYDRFPVVTITRNYEKNTAEVKQVGIWEGRPWGLVIFMVECHHVRGAKSTESPLYIGKKQNLVNRINTRWSHTHEIK